MAAVLAYIQQKDVAQIYVQGGYIILQQHIVERFLIQYHILLVTHHPK